MRTDVTSTSYTRRAAPSAYQIGKMLLDVGRLTDAERQRVLEKQEETGMRFGEVAVSLGLLDASEVQEVLARQCESLLEQEKFNRFSDHVVAFHAPFSPQVSALRSIRTELLTSTRDSRRRAIALVSVNSGAGPSYFAANLAVVFAQCGSRTALIDTNLGSGFLHEVFNLDNRLGLSDILSGRGGLQVIRQCELLPNLWVLPAGVPTESPTQLMCRSSFGALVETLDNCYDVVLYDVCATQDMDALAVATNAKNVLLVVAKDKTPVSVVADVHDQLHRTGAKILGSVLIET